jgi:hypothetical protein
MDTFELRNYYAQLTGDVTNAFAPREDDVEGFLYSDESIKRAIDTIENTKRLSDQSMFSQAMSDYGPRAGVGIGRIGTLFNPQSAYSNVTNDLDDAKRAYGQRDYGSMFKSLGNAGMQGMSTNRLRREGAARGLFEFIKSLM